MAQENLLEVSYKVALDLYYSDELPTEERDKLSIKLNYIIKQLPLEDKTKWIDKIVEEMLEYGACLDKQDGLDHIKNVWMRIMKIVVV
jgi:hypothetical protein